MEIEFIVTIIVTSVSGVLLFLMARTLSERIEKRMKKSKEMETILKDQINELTSRLKVQTQTIEKKDAEIESLKVALMAGEERITELQERLKFAEQVSARDIDQVRRSIEQLQGMFRALFGRISMMESSLEKKERKTKK